jgi:outer membrane murein-binding lipoprotein Lpp
MGQWRRQPSWVGGASMMTAFVFASIIAIAGGLGGLANYLLLTTADDVGSRYRAFDSDGIRRALRFAVAGAITAFIVPLFLSLAQSSLVKSIFDSKDRSLELTDIFIFIGFCIVAGFASRRFMDTLTNNVLQLQQAVKKLDGKAEAAEEKAEAAEKKADEALASTELTDESIDVTARAAGVSKEPVASIPEASAPSAEATAIAAELGNQERAALQAMGVLSKRTRTGIARDAKISRNKIGDVIKGLIDRGILEATTSANTGGNRVALTPLGANVQSALRAALPNDPVRADADQASR